MARMEYHHEVFCHEWIGVPDEGASEPCSTCGSVFEHEPKNVPAHSHLDAESTGNYGNEFDPPRISTWAEREAMFTDPFEGCREDDR